MMNRCNIAVIGVGELTETATMCTRGHITKEDIRILYPNPTVWSSHVFIALDEAGTAGIDALMDEEIQKLAWNRHGFRTGINGSASGTEQFGVEGVAEQVTRVMNMPDADTMERIIEALQ